MTTLLPEVQLADDHIVDMARFDELIQQAEEIAVLSLERTMFGPEEVLNHMLDTRKILIEARATVLASMAIPA